MPELDTAELFAEFVEDDGTSHPRHVGVVVHSPVATDSQV